MVLAVFDSQVGVVGSAGFPSLYIPTPNWVVVAKILEESRPRHGQRHTLALRKLRPADSADLLFAAASHVEKRVDALQAPSAERPALTRVAFIAAWASLTVSLISSVVELHHLVAFVQHICTGN